MNLFKIMRSLHETPEVEHWQFEMVIHDVNIGIVKERITVHRFIVDHEDTDNTIVIRHFSDGEVRLSNNVVTADSDFFTRNDVDEEMLIFMLRTAQEKDWDVKSLAVLFDMKFVEC